MSSFSTDVARIVMYTAPYPEHADPFDRKNVDNYTQFKINLSRSSINPIIEAKSFFDFRQLLTTGGFWGALVIYPEYLTDQETVSLFELIPNMGALVNCFVAVTNRSRESFPIENEKYGNVVRLFAPRQKDQKKILNYVFDHLADRGKKPNTNFMPPWEEEPRGYFTSCDEWPSEVATACEQYLLVFRDFLAEIGIAAKTNIGHEAGKVLFSVVPDDPEVALEAISGALTVYLQLPTITKGTSMAPSDSIAVMKLQAQVDHYRSQSMFAMATIQQQQISIDLLRRAAPTSEQLSSAEIPPAPETNLVVESEATVLWGLLKIGDVEIRKGLSCPLGEIINRGRAYVANYRQNDWKRLEGPK